MSANGDETTTRSYLISLMTPVLARVGRSALSPYLWDMSGARIDNYVTHRVFMILAPISINLTVSTNAELIYVGWGLIVISTTRLGTESGVQSVASSCSSMVGIGVLQMC